MENSQLNGTIEEISVEDLPRCRAFWSVPEDVDAFRLTRLMRSGERKAFVYRLNGDYVGGCALSKRDETCGHLSFFAVTAALRRNGIGSLLLDFATRYFHALGMEKMRLHVYKNNSDAIRLYERKGFRYAFDITPEKVAMLKDL